MMQRLLVALLTVAVFLAGYGARVWTEPRPAVPPVPAALAQELTPAKPEATNAKQLEHRVKLVAEIEKLRPQIEAYRSQVTEIYAEFDREFLQLLNKDQCEKFLANKQKGIDAEAKRIAASQPLSDDEIDYHRQRPLTDVYWMVTVTPRLERFTHEYRLDAAQQERTRALLALRSRKFLALLDSTPHVSIRLSRLAPVIERVAPRTEPQETEKK